MITLINHFSFRGPSGWIPAALCQFHQFPPDTCQEDVLGLQFGLFFPREPKILHTLFSSLADLGFCSSFCDGDALNFAAAAAERWRENVRKIIILYPSDRSSTLIGSRSRRHLVQLGCARSLFQCGNPTRKNPLHDPIFTSFRHFHYFCVNFHTFHRKLRHFVQICKNLLQRLSNVRPIRSVLLFFAVASTHTSAVTYSRFPSSHHHTQSRSENLGTLSHLCVCMRVCTI